MLLPPSEAGTEKLTVAPALPAVAVMFVGALGTVAGVTVFEGLDGRLVPSMFFAVTVNE
jgi:hypothetical protein